LTDNIPGWLQFGALVAYAAIVYYIARQYGERWIPDSYRKPLTYALWLAVPLLVVPFSQAIGSTWVFIAMATLLPAGFAFLLDEQGRSGV
jgi:fatty acid desaturase